MANQWFRMYAEFANDPKVQMLSEIYQRRLVMMFCLRCNGNETLQDEQVAFQLRISETEWQETKAEFINRGFINDDNKLLNWNKRQFRSDSSTERVRKHREDKKHADETLCNVSVTPQIQNRTDAEQKEKNTKKENPDFEEFWKLYPKQRAGNQEKAEAAYRQALTRSSASEILMGLKSYADSDEVKDGFAKGAAAWLNDDRWKTDYGKVAVNGHKPDVKPIELTPEKQEDLKKWHLTKGYQHPIYNPEGITA